MRNARAKARTLDRRETWIAWSSALTICGLIMISGVLAAVEDEPFVAPAAQPSDDIITGSIPRGVSDPTNVRMQFIQEDGPRAGHVKVVLTPDDRPLTMDEARSAARQAFLETLNDPVFMDDLKIVTVIVHRFPDTVDASIDFSIRFEARGGGQWSIYGDE